jgi:hypothetical protein
MGSSDDTREATMPYNEAIDERIRKVVSRLKQSYTRPFDITGKPMKGWVMVDGTGFKTDDSLESWLNKAKAFVKTLPPK